MMSRGKLAGTAFALRYMIFISKVEPNFRRATSTCDCHAMVGAMRLRHAGTVLGTVIARAALADPVPPESAYPQAAADRPILLYGGMTELDVDEQLRSTTSSSFSNRTPDLNLRHAFGSIELDADAGELGTLAANIDTRSLPGVVRISASTGVVQRDQSVTEGQAVSIEQKLHLVPGRLAGFFAIAVSLNENRTHDETGMLVWTHVIAAHATAQAVIQLSPRLAVVPSAYVHLPFEQSMVATLQFDSSVDAGLNALVALGAWDLFANFSVADVSQRQLPYVAAGFSKRWGR